MGGVISKFCTHVPTSVELEECQWLILTADSIWDPHSPDFAENERILHERNSDYMRYERKNYSLSQFCAKPDAFIDDPVTRNLSAITSSLTITGLYEQIKEQRAISGINSGLTRGEITEERLARLWNIPLKTAAQTIRVTTQRGMRMAVHPLHARYRTKQAQLHYNQLSGRHGRFYSDTMLSSVKSTHGNTCGQIFINDINFTRFYPGRSKGEAGNALLDLIRDIGIPSELLTDDAKETMGGKWKQVTTEHDIRSNLTEPYSPFQNRAEGGIRELKKAISRTMKKLQAPKRLWDYCAEYHAQIRCLIATNLYHLNGCTPYEIVTHNTPDISEYAQYQWYEPVWFYDQLRAFPHEKQTLGRWLGVAHKVGQALCYFILRSNGQVIARMTVQPIPTEELATEGFKQQLTAFDHAVYECLGDPDFVDEVVPHPSRPRMIDINDDNLEPWEEEAVMSEADDVPPDFLNNYIAAHILLPKGDTFVKGQVIARKRDANGQAKGKPHINPILDSRVYEVQFPDGHTEEYAANVIAEAIFSQVDEEGNEHLILDEIIDHRKDLAIAVSDEDRWILSANGNRHHKKTTKGWDLCILWKDKSTSWVPLKHLKEGHPVQVAEYAMANGIANEPAFAWWIKHAIKTRDRIICAVKSRYLKRTHKFGIELPKTVKEALDIDCVTGTGG